MPRSRTFKIFHTLYLLVIAVLLTLLFVERQQQPDEPSTSALAEHIENTQEALATQVRNLSQQMDTRFAALEERLPPPHQQDEPRRTAPPASTQNPPVDSISESRDSTPAPALEEMSSGDYARLGSAMVDDFDARQREFDMQSVDPDWADATSALIRERFSEDDYLNDMQLVAIECRSSICQVDIGVSDPASINPARLLQALHGINESEQNLVYQLTSHPSGNTHRVLVLRAL